MLLAFAAIYFIWGSTFLAIRFAVESIPPLLMMGIRHLGAGSLLMGWLKMRGTKIDRKLWMQAAIGGMFLFIGSHGTLAIAEQHIPSGRAALIVATIPLWMVLLAWIRRQQRLTASIVCGLVLGLLGVSLLVKGDLHSSNYLADIGLLFGALCWAIGSIYGRGLKNVGSPVAFAAMEMLCGGVMLLVLGTATGEERHLTMAALAAKPVLSLLFMIVFGSIVAFSAYNWLLMASTPARVATYAYVNPVVAVVMGCALAGEPFTLRDGLGAAVIVASVILVVASKKEEARRPEREMVVAAE